MSREIKFRAWLTLSDYDDEGDDRDYHAMIGHISVSTGGHVGFSSDEGKAAFGSDVFERAIENGNAYEYDEWCGWEGPFELMQYTGLKDKNGVEIYEGDLVAHNQLDSRKRLIQTMYEVRWGEYYNNLDYEDRVEGLGVWLYEVRYTHAGKHEKPTGSRVYDYNGLWGDYKLLEVIGNIYENPELLDAKS